jgi:hypothetical protein
MVEVKRPTAVDRHKNEIRGALFILAFPFGSLGSVGESSAWLEAIFMPMYESTLVAVFFKPLAAVPALASVRV